MSLTMICSAFRKEATPHANALATAKLIEFLARSSLSLELCIGSYEGEREISLQVTGFENEEDMRYYANAVIHVWRQEAVYFSINRTAWLHFGGSYPDTRLGGESFGISTNGGASYTEYLNHSVRSVLPPTNPGD